LIVGAARAPVKRLPAAMNEKRMMKAMGGIIPRNEFERGFVAVI
jgi:hypothetical protein